MYLHEVGSRMRVVDSWLYHKDVCIGSRGKMKMNEKKNLYKKKTDSNKKNRPYSLYGDVIIIISITIGINKRQHLPSY